MSYTFTTFATFAFAFTLSLALTRSGQVRRIEIIPASLAFALGHNVGNGLGRHQIQLQMSAVRARLWLEKRMGSLERSGNYSQARDPRQEILCVFIKNFTFPLPTRWVTKKEFLEPKLLRSSFEV